MVGVWKSTLVVRSRTGGEAAGIRNCRMRRHRPCDVSWTTQGERRSLCGWMYTHAQVEKSTLCLRHSGLSASEEIPTDERLEKDMASEMAELWRVEASGAAVVQRLAQRGASSTLVEGLLRLQRCGDDEDDDDGRRGGSLSPPLRTQVLGGHAWGHCSRSRSNGSSRLQRDFQASVVFVLLLGLPLNLFLPGIITLACAVFSIFASSSNLRPRSAETCGRRTGLVVLQIVDSANPEFCRETPKVPEPLAFRGRTRIYKNPAVALLAIRPEAI